MSGVVVTDPLRGAPESTPEVVTAFAPFRAATSHEAQDRTGRLACRKDGQG